MGNIKGSIRKVAAEFLGREPAAAPRFIKDALVVSFDVFDTLVVRNCSAPHVVFDIVERRYNRLYPSAQVSGFRRARVDAEMRARKAVAAEEPTIFEIYALLGDGLAKVAPELLRLELDTEMSICRPNPEIKSLFDQALAEGKRVVIASDMYLDAVFISKILKNCGYAGYERLYVSADYGVTKRSGGLFGVIQREVGVASRDIIHIGDHPISDFLAPKRAGMRSVLYRKRPSDLGLFRSRFGYHGDALDNDALSIAVAHGIRNNGVDARDWMGYAVLGPLLFGYATWLRKLWEEQGCPGILFLAREGDILMRAWHRLYGDEGVARYINVSRLALCRAMAGEAKDYEELFALFSCLMSGCEKLSDFLELVGADPSEIDWNGCDLVGELSLDSLDGDAVYSLVRQHCLGRFEVQRELLLKYLQEHTRFGDGVVASDCIFVCDIGWAGTMQSLLQRVLPNKRLLGTYLAVSDFQDSKACPLNRRELDRRGYWCGSDGWKTHGQALRFTQSAMELLFLNGEGTTIAYEIEADEVVSVKETSDSLAEARRSAKRLHDAALRFVDDCKAINLEALIGPIDCESAMLPYLNTVVRPTKRALSAYAHFRFEDGVKSMSLLPRHRLRYYVAHPKAAVRELELNNSKILWFKGVFRLPLPYYGLLRFLTARAGIKSAYSKRLESSNDPAPSCESRVLPE